MQMVVNPRLRIVVLLFLLHPLLTFAARRGGGGGVSPPSGSYSGGNGSSGGGRTPSNNVEVKLSFDYAEPIDLTVFSFCVVFAVAAFTQAYIIIVHPLCVQIPLPHIRRQPDETPSLGFEWLFALSSLSLLVYWILSAVFQAILTSSVTLTLTPAFFAFRQWLYRFHGTLLLCACALLLRERARKHEVPAALTSYAKGIIDAALVLWMLTAQSLGIATTFHTLRATTLNDYTYRVLQYYTRGLHVFTASELALALDVFITSLALHISLLKEKKLDRFIPTLAKRVTPLLLILAIFHVIPLVLADQYNFTFNNLIYPELCLSEVLIHRIVTAFTLGYLAAMDRSRYLNTPSPRAKVEIEV